MKDMPLIICMFITAAWLARLMTVICHELGHALPAILLTRQKVSVYLGSYGDPNKSIRFQIGLLEVWVRLSFSWKGGLCVASARDITPNREIIFTLCGPIASFLLALLGTYLIFSFDMHGALKLLTVFFMGSALLDLYWSLVPMSDNTILYKGGICYNDGYQLKLLWEGKQFMKEYERAAMHYRNEEYSIAAPILEGLLAKDMGTDYLYRFTIFAFIQLPDYGKVLQIHERMQEKQISLTADDYVNSGLAKSHLSMLQESLEDYDRALAFDAGNVLALNNKGYTYNLMEAYAEAIPLFDQTLEIDADFSHAYSNRGFAKIKLGRVEEGLAEIRHALSLNPDNAYAYKYLGLHHLDIQAYGEALELFKKAKQIAPGTYLIDGCIKEADEKMQIPV